MVQLLVVIDGADQGRSYPLGDGASLTIGSSHKRADIRLNDIYVSRVHCYVEVAEGRVIITDAEDSNGTMINGQKIARQELLTGEVLRVGNTRFRLDPDDGSAGNRPPAAVKATAQQSGRKAAETMLAIPALAPAAGAKPVEALADTAFAHFQLGPVIGKGHLGVVFRARELDNDDVVAIKIFHPDFPQSDEEMDRFIHAMRVTPPLRHANFVMNLGVGRTPPYCWKVTELVRGESLAQVIQRHQASGRRDWRPAFRLAVHVGRALHFAHHHQLVHRNLTPQNILYRSTDSTYKLSDLNQGRAFAGSQLRQRIIKAKTQSEVAFVAPEQLGPQATADARTDIYSLGAAVYALLTGKPPFVGKTMAETISLIREAEPAPPKQWQPALPDAFEAVLRKMLQRKPEERYQTAAELLSDLAKIAPDPI